MLSKETVEFVAQLTGILRHIDLGDPSGQSKTAQILVALAVRELATGVQEAGPRRQIQVSADEVILRSSRQPESADREAMTAVSA